MKKFNQALIFSALAMTTALSANAEMFEIVVKHKPQMSAMSLDNKSKKVMMATTLSRTNIELASVKHRTLNASNYSIVSIDASSAEHARSILEQTGQFDSVDIVPQMTVPEPKGRAYPNISGTSSATNTPTDLYYYDQRLYMGALKKSDGYRGDAFTGHNFESVWANEPEETKEILVGVADSGFYAHIDIDFAEQSADFVDMDTDAFGDPADIHPEDGGHCSPHGNGVSSAISAIHDGEIGIVGSSTNAKVVAARVMNCGMGGLQFVDAINWFNGESFADEGIPDIERPVDVINLSLGGPSSRCPDIAQEAINNSVANGVPVVVAAGNSDTPVSDFFPANCDNVIVVGATGWNSDKASFSNYGEGIDVTAQGVDILGYGSQGEEDISYALWWEGTSNAAPQAVGAIANVMSQVEGLSVSDIEYLLKTTSNNYVSDSDCVTQGDICGKGALNADNLVNAAIRYANNELGYIKHSLADEIEEVAEFYIEQTSGLKVCDMYTVSFNEFSAQKSGLTYKGYRVEKGGNLSVDDASLYIDSESKPHFNMAMTADELEAYDYGYSMCDGETCSDIMPMAVNSIKPSVCQ